MRSTSSVAALRLLASCLARVCRSRRTRRYAVKVGTSQISMVVRMCTSSRIRVVPAGLAGSVPRRSCRRSVGCRRCLAEEIRAEWRQSHPTASRALGVDRRIRRGRDHRAVGAKRSGKTTLAHCSPGSTCGPGVRDVGRQADADLDAGHCSSSLDPGAGHPRWPFTVRRQRRDRPPPLRADAARAAAAASPAARRAGHEVPGRWNALLALDQLGGSSVSGGQWQKVALARVFFRDARSWFSTNRRRADRRPSDTFRRVSELPEAGPSCSSRTGCQRPQRRPHLRARSWRITEAGRTTS